MKKKILLFWMIIVVATITIYCIYAIRTQEDGVRLSEVHPYMEYNDRSITIEDMPNNFMEEVVCNLYMGEITGENEHLVSVVLDETYLDLPFYEKSNEFGYHADYGASTIILHDMKTLDTVDAYDKYLHGQYMFNIDDYDIVATDYSIVLLDFTYEYTEKAIAESRHLMAAKGTYEDRFHIFACENGEWKYIARQIIQ